MTSFLLHLLRHGAPVRPGRLMGRTDGAPTEAGIGECVTKTRDLRLDVVIASDLCRARLAGEAISKGFDVPLTVDPRWREMDFGAWDGLPSDAVDADAFDRFHADPDGHPPPEGERWSALAERVGEAIDELAPHPTLVVTHGGAMRAALSHLCGLEQGRTWAVDLPYAACLSLRVWPGETPVAQIVSLS